MSSEYNPYAPPSIDITPELEDETTLPIRLAGKGRRLGTLLIDYVCFLAAACCLGIAIAFLFGEEALERLTEIPDTLLGGIIMICYYCFFEGIWSRTPGKFVLGTIVVNEAGGKPSFGQILGRTLARFIPFEPFSCLGERGWHDSVSKTQVVRIR